MEERFAGFRELLQRRSGSALPALAYDRGGEKQLLSYAGFAGQAFAREAQYRKDGAGLVLLAAETSPETVVSLFAHILAGQDVLLCDPSLPDELFLQAARMTRAEAAEADPELLELLAPALARPSGRRRGGEGRLIFFTSGTSARSKAAVLTSDAFCRSAWNGQSMLPCREGDVLLSILPLAHVFGFVCSLLWGLGYGACVALGRGRRHFLDDCRYFEPTILPAVPALLEALLRMDALNPGLRTVLIGAAPCTEQTIRAVRAKGISVRFGYGLTETASGLAISTEDDDPFAMALCPDTEAMIEEGEIAVRTPCLMESYFGGENPAVNGKFYTGDLGYLDDRGRLHVTGRKKEMLVLPSGVKIFCPEAERALERLLPGAEAAVVLRGGRPVLLAAGCPAELAEKAVAAYNRTVPRAEQLAGAALHPGPLPRTATGKLKRWMLEENA